MRGPLLPGATAAGSPSPPQGLPRPVPAARTRAERFDDHLLAAVEELEERWQEQLAEVEFVVADVPPGELLADVVPGLADPDAVPLSHLVPAGPRSRGVPATPARIVIFRRPIEARAADVADAADLVLDVVIHEVAALLGLSPAEIDPEGHGDDDD